MKPHLPGRHRPAGRATAPVAVGYLRRSTDRQEQSLPDQKRAVEVYAADNGLRLHHLYVDDAISGTSAAQRKAFQQMLTDAQQPSCPFRYVVVYDVKRFGRLDNDEAGYYRHMLRMHDVEVLYVSENFNGDATDDLLRPVKQWQARQESKDLSKVTIRGLLSKAEGGWWMGGVPPYGFDLRYENERGEFLFVVRFMPDGTKQVLDEEGKLDRTLARGERVAISKRDRARLTPSEAGRVSVVERIFKMAAEEQRGFAAIASALNDDGIPPPRGPAWSRIHSGKWVSSTIREILSNPLYTGDMVWNRRTDGRFHKIKGGRAVERSDAYGARLVPNPKEDWIVIRGTHSSLVSRRLAEQARRVRESRATSQKQQGRNPRLVGGWRGQRARYLLTGLVVCGRCGGRYEGCVRRKGKPRKDGSLVKTHYYGCGSYIRQGRPACVFGPVKQGLLEEAVVEAVVKFYKERYEGDRGRRRLRDAIRDGVGSESVEVDGAKERVQQERAGIEDKVTKLLDNITSTNRDFVDRRLQELGRQRESLAQRGQELDELLLGRVEESEVYTGVRAFLGTLEGVLHDGTPEQRIVAIRKCMVQVVVEEKDSPIRIQLHDVTAAEFTATSWIEVDAPY